MKLIITIITITLLSIVKSASAQNINWKNFSVNQKQIATVSSGFDNGFTGGISYGYKFNLIRPAVLSVEYSSPFGKKMFDDFKTKTGVQVKIASFNNFAATVKVNGIYRRYQSKLVTLANFGSEFTGVVGYYKTKWFVAVEFSFDKAIVTHIKNSPTMKEIYADVKDGWYIPTGGNFFYGIQTGYSFNKFDVTMKVGKTVTQDFKTTATIPVYAMLGLNRKF